MSEFKPFAVAVNNNVLAMSATGLFMTNIDKDALWDLYLSSFPAGTNPLYRERTEHDCTCCKQFIRNIGGVVTITPDYEMITIWDGIQLGNEYDVVAAALSAYVKQHAIVDVYFNDTKKVGVESNHEMKDGNVRTYNHFHTDLLSKFVLRGDDIASKKGEIRQAVEVFRRSAEELTLESVEIVLELIDQNSLYRGDEHKHTVKNFFDFKRKLFPRVQQMPEAQKSMFYWYEGTRENVARSLGIRNTVIGTLLQDLSEGRDLETAVKSFEAKVAPTNYKRPTALVTKSMIENAQKEVEALGLTDSLGRRYAVYDDLTINNVLFADLAAQKKMDPFAQLASEVKTPTKSLDKVEEITIDDFLANVLPKAHSMEVLVENSHTGNLMSLIAPATAGAPNLFKWNNGFSWSYNGEVADSIKERVKTAGGNVDGFLRVSLAWHNNDDLDLSMNDPLHNHVYYHNRRSATGATLDIDMNGMDGIDPNRRPVENIFFSDERRLRDGEYKFYVTNFRQRETCDAGFEIEVEYKGQTKRYSHPVMKDKDRILAVVIDVRAGQVVDIRSDLKDDARSQEIWGIKTAVFQKVQLVLNSPNHWDGEQTGNKHVFFILEGCANPVGTRGFYNEYLKPELDKHRKVFEMLGGKIKVQPSTEQLSGLGFSTTQRNHVFVKVSGSFNRTVKVVF
ncbi:hypothetical protein [Enterobacter phage EspM4VN]|uniref:Uncharacterized protein n=1 Tax=Enterobacter phage EspM4VN TaxID=2137745 RepID=A0A4P2WVP3_9CAUD|nr:hypothetical protein HYP11_gp167 [Enterobacter phage EspM4VN]BBK03794.1 hypothetical protein [Enterobacter phage EspM4VN]